ncbi:ABC transporter permease [Anaeromicropila herbilytica]|uniref:ABC-2 family transporter protein n=1 Tax=Anaeromicropila herbilytica TaxID=2785025 RepID=A0A7R7ENP4_9FIRM|nr:ABC transporter permease subunit [Anaeromicropila herbilytica]BCN32231.1 hypothetical protein bsdtb5_35260 [Anaeromicropila herbilytica]
MFHTNPVYKKELKISVRTIKTAMIILAYNMILAVIGLFVFYASFDYKSTIAGVVNYHNMMNLYEILSVIEFALILFIVPAITSGAISGERERQTLDILLTTKLTPLQIIRGKLASSISLILLIVVSSLPILSIVFSIGGIRIIDLIQLMMCIVVTAIFVGSIGLFFSVLFRRTTVSTVFTYGTVIFLVLGTIGILTGVYLIINVRIDTNVVEDAAHRIAPNLGNMILMLLVNPAITLLSLFSNQFKNKEFLSDFLNNYGQCNRVVTEHWFGISVTIQLLISIILIIMSARLLDPLKRGNTKRGNSRRSKTKRKKNNQY